LQDLPERRFFDIRRRISHALSSSAKRGGVDAGQPIYVLPSNQCEIETVRFAIAAFSDRQLYIEDCSMVAV